MKLKIGRMIGVLWLGLLLLSSMSAQEPKLRDTLKGHAECVYAVAYSLDGKSLASGSGDGTIKLWNVATCIEQANLNSHMYPVRSVAYNQDGRTLASGS